MKTVNAFLVYMILTPVSVACSQSNEPRFCVGAATEIHSAVLDEDREILMHLPASYDSTKDRYPVLYVLDGEWNFLHAISYITYLSDNNIAPEMIIVAIATTNRPRDFLPTHVPQVPESGGSDRFIAFLADELIPFVDRKYRTDTTRILYGESNSGLFGVYSLLTEPDLFEAYIVNCIAIDQYDAVRGHYRFFDVSVRDVAPYHVIISIITDKAFPRTGYLIELTVIDIKE